MRAAPAELRSCATHGVRFRDYWGCAPRRQSCALRSAWERLGAPGSAWERLGAPGRAWERLGAHGSAGKRLGALGSAWERLGAPGALGSAWDGLGRFWWQSY